MWPFTRKYKLKASGLMSGLTDYHSHVLPGVDDGISKPEEALKVIKEYEAMGVDTLWLTPHIMEDMPNTTADLRHRFAEFVQLYNGPVKLHLASENMLDNVFEERLKSNDFLPLGKDGRHLLVETSYFTPPADFHNKLSKVFKAGYFPLLAHPERYVYIEDDSQYDDLHDMGIRMQLNLSSLFGFYGREAREKAEYLLENGYYNAIGSDTHRFSQVKTSIERGMLSRKHLNMLQAIPGIDQ